MEIGSLAILAFPRHGIEILRSSFSTGVGTKVERCWTGVDPATRVASGNARDGLRVINSSANVIGTPGEGNIVGGNKWGIRIAGASSSYNRILGNWIGTDPSGTFGLFPRSSLGEPWSSPQ